ncbi:MAG: autoinducer binding domain-containing protein, partial [Pseudomonadota bacterium]
MDQSRSKTAALELGLSRLRRLSPDGYALGLHVRFASAHIMVQTYAAEWTERYTQNGHMLSDPVVLWGFANEGACRWSALGMPDPNNILGQAREFGLNFGVAVSHGPLSSRSIGGFARGDREFTDAEIASILDTVEHLHTQSTPPETLTEAQRQALRQVASGSRYTEAAAILGISESALKARLKSARERLFAR